MGAGFGGVDDDEDLISGINITPLVDVVLVLLIIFMIAAPVIYQSTIKVQLPKAASGEAVNKSPLQFTITREGDLFLDQTKMAWKDVVPRIKSMGPAVFQNAVLISADQFTPHGKVVELMDLLRGQGLIRFSLNVETKR